MDVTTAGISFSESMAGTLLLGEADPHTLAGAAGSAIRIRPTIVIADARAFVADETHPGQISGLVDFAPFGSGIPAHGGKFQLFVKSGDPSLKWMVYELAFEHAGKFYYLAGKKQVHSGSISHLWRDTTTLFAQLHAGSDSSRPVIGAGVLQLGFADLIRMIFTFRSPGARSFLEGMRAIAIFTRFFLAQLWASYGFHRRPKTTGPTGEHTFEYRARIPATIWRAQSASISRAREIRAAVGRQQEAPFASHERRHARSHRHDTGTRDDRTDILCRYGAAESRGIPRCQGLRRVAVRLAHEPTAQHAPVSVHPG